MNNPPEEEAMMIMDGHEYQQKQLQNQQQAAEDIIIMNSNSSNNKHIIENTSTAGADSSAAVGPAATSCNMFDERESYGREAQKLRHEHQQTQHNSSPFNNFACRRAMKLASGSSCAVGIQVDNLQGSRRDLYLQNVPVETNEENRVTIYCAAGNHLKRQHKSQLSRDSSDDDNDDDEDHGDFSGSDTDEFLEHARHVIAEQNLSYDSASFRDFEMLLQQHIQNHFRDDDTDQDSLVSTTSFSGYMNDDGGICSRKQKETLLHTPIISDQAYHRMASMIARPKKKVSDVETTDDGAGTKERHSASSTQNPAFTSSSSKYMFNVDDSDESTVATSTASVQSLVRSCSFPGKRFCRKQTRAYDLYPNNSSIASDDDDNNDKFLSNITPKPRPPRRRFLANAASRKQRRQHLPPIGPPSKRSRSSPPTSTEQNSSQSPSTAFDDCTLNMNKTFSREDNGTSLDSPPKISALFPSPTQKEKALDYLKSRAPSLHESVVARLQIESTANRDRIGTDTQQTPDKSKSIRSSIASSPSLTSPESTDSRPHQIDIEVVLSEQKLTKNEDPVIVGVQESLIEYSNNNILPSRSTGAYDDVTSLPEMAKVDALTFALHEMKLKVEKKSISIDEVAQRTDGRQDSTDNISERGMALVHKFRARRKVALQAEYLQRADQTSLLNGSSKVMSNRPQSSPHSENIPFNPPIIDTPEKLGEYLRGNISCLTSSESSTLEDKRRRLQFLKDKRSRARLFHQKQKAESKRSLLWESPSYPLSEESLSELNSSARNCADHNTALVEKVSPFKGKALSMTRQNESSYEMLKASPDDSYKDALSSNLSRPTISSPASDLRGRKAKEIYTVHGSDLNSEDIRRIISPQSPDRVSSPIHGALALSFSSANAYDSTIFEDANSMEEEGCLVPISSKSSDAWDASDLSFQSDPNLFVESSKTCFSKHRKWQNLFQAERTKIQDTVFDCKIAIDQSTPNTALVVCEFNDSFDEIVTRQTPCQKLSVDDPFESSPAGVADLFASHCQIFSPQARKSTTMQSKKASRQAGGAKSGDGEPIDLGFVDDEDGDLVFADRSSDGLSSSSPSEGTIEPIFLSMRMFEI